MSDAGLQYEFSAGERVALALEYDGSAFRGWQSQRKPRVPTVQDSLQEALSTIANQAITVQCAGRTDAGVHGSHQVVHFDTPVPREAKAWVMGGNTQLPDGVAVKWAHPVSADFHARFSATARRYRYVINNTPLRSALLSQGVTQFTYPLDAELMHAEAQVLIGELDFTSFRAVACQSNTPMRNVHHVRVMRCGDLVVIDIQANAFLYHMVRNIAGALMAVGAGLQPPGWVKQVLDARDRCEAGVTASPKGLYLVDVLYPAEFGLPTEVVGPLFLRDSLSFKGG